MKCMGCGAPVDELIYYCPKCQQELDEQERKEEFEEKYGPDEPIPVAVEANSQEAAWEEDEDDDDDEIDPDEWLDKTDFTGDSVDDLREKLRVARRLLILNLLERPLPPNFRRHIRLPRTSVVFQRYWRVRKAYISRKNG